MTRSTTGDAAHKAEVEAELLILALLALNNLVQKRHESEARKLLAAPEGADLKALAAHVAELDAAAQVKLIELADYWTALRYDPHSGRFKKKRTERPEGELQELLGGGERAARKVLAARIAELEAERIESYEARVKSANDAAEAAAATRALLEAERDAAREARGVAYDESVAKMNELAAFCERYRSQAEDVRKHLDATFAELRGVRRKVEWWRGCAFIFAMAALFQLALLLS